MPDHKVHRYVSRLLLGKHYEKIDKALDAPVKTLGRGHRAFFHSPREAAIIGYRLGGVDGATAALLHIYLDQLSTRDDVVKEILRQVASRKRAKSEI